MNTKKRFLFVPALVIAACFLFCPAAMAGKDIIDPEVLAAFQQQGGELSRDMRDLEGLLPRMKNKKASGVSTQKELSEFRALRKSIISSQPAIFARLHDMEQSLIAHGADSVFLERHRKMTKEMKDRFAGLAGQLNRENLDDLAEKGIRSIMKGQRKPGAGKSVIAVEFK